MGDTSTKTVIFTAPQGWGKTRQKEALAKEFGCASYVVDEWWPGQPVMRGHLHLTSEPPYRLKATARRYTVIQRGWDEQKAVP